jgi:uncharacterized protein DUF2703
MGNCACPPSGPVEKGLTNVLKIKWHRLISDEETCPRCGFQRRKSLERLYPTLKQSLAPLWIEVILEKEELSIAEFKKEPLQSNRIWINNRLLEDWVEGKVGHIPCCDVCGPDE